MPHASERNPQKVVTFGHFDETRENSILLADLVIIMTTSIKQLISQDTAKIIWQRTL